MPQPLSLKFSAVHYLYIVQKFNIIESELVTASKKKPQDNFQLYFVDVPA